MNSGLFIIGLSIVLQLAATALAVRLILLTGKRRTGLVFLAVVLLMTLERAMTFYSLTGGRGAEAGLITEGVDLVIAFCLVIGIIFITRLMVSMRDTNNSLRYGERRYRILFEESPVSLWEEDCSQVVEYMDSLRAKGVNDFRAYFEEHPEEVAHCAGMVKVVLVNKASVELHEAENEESLFSGLPRLFNDESYRTFKNGLLALAEGKTTMKDEGVVLTLGGEPRHVAVQWSFIPDGAESRAKMIVSTVDITERKKAEEVLKESEEKFRTLAEESPNMIFLNKRGRVVYANRKAQEIMGYTLEEFTSPDFDFISLIAPEFKGLVRDNFSRHMKGEDVQPYEYALITKTGERIDTIITTKLIHFEGAKTILGIVTDITQRKKAENELRRSREFIGNILDSVDEGFIVIGRDYRIMLANRAYCRQMNVPVGEVVGKYCFEVSHRRASPCFEAGEECAVYHSFETGEPYVSFHRHEDREGNLLYVETKSYPLKDASGAVTSAIEVINNITDRHLLEEQLLRTQKLEAVGLLAGGIAHDFNNLLQGVFGNISMAKMASDKGGEVYGMLEKAEKALRLSMNLTKQLLTFSKGGEPVKKIISLQLVIKDSVKFALSGSNIEYSFDAVADLWPVEADGGQIGQVVQNIVLNAADAMPGGGTVVINARNFLLGEEGLLPLRCGRYVRIAIEDNGPGIPASYLGRIFDPYFTTKEKGTGLGLATSYSIIKKHGGVLDVKSEVGLGSTFFIYLPASDKELTPEPAGSGNLLPGQGKILVMDDERIVRTIVGQMLTAIGYEVDFADEGNEALKKYSAALESGRPFDAVILDLTVRGGMGGGDTIKKMREMDPSVRAIVSSGYSDDPIVANYADYGFKASLSKPFEVEELSGVLHALLSAEGT
jgi:PAS domain S-box-containing protein